MAEHGDDPKNGARTPPEPAHEIPLGIHDHRGEIATHERVRAVNVIAPHRDTPADLPVVAICPYCRADLSTVALGRYVEDAGGVGVQALYPLRCPECKHPLLYMTVSPIVTPRGA